VAVLLLLPALVGQAVSGAFAGAAGQHVHDEEKSNRGYFVTTREYGK
jgi:hypothetical protein